MINELNKIRTSPYKEIVMAEFKELCEAGEFHVVRYTWQELKHIAQYLLDCHGYIQGVSGEYTGEILDPYNVVERGYIFAIVRALASNNVDLHSLRSAVRVDNQRLARWIRKLNHELNDVSFIGKLKRKLKG